jgi:hypothetical protein
MKLYVKAISSYRSDREDIDVKKELKSRYKLDTRRQDAFIHLAVLGAQRLRESAEIYENDELFLTSGVGNIDVIARTNIAVVENHQFIKPFDFINMLGNTTSYYVATSLGVKGKNIFDISDNFTYFNTLVLIYASLKSSNNEAVCGAIDLVSEYDEVFRRVMGVAQDIAVVSSVNYQKLSTKPEDAIAAVEFDTKSYTKEEIESLIAESGLKVYASMRCRDIDALQSKAFFETDASGWINSMIRDKESALYVESYNEKYKLLQVSML